MTTEQILKVLKNERECIARQSRPLGEMPQCRKDDDGVKLCEYCDLCLPDTEILEVYDFLINGYEMLQNEGAESYTIKCKEPLSEDQKANLKAIWGTCEEKATFVIDDFEPFKMPDNMKAVILGESTKPRCTNCGGELDKYNYCKECGYKLYDVTTGNDIMRQYKSMLPIEEGDTD